VGAAAATTMTPSPTNKAREKSNDTFVKMTTFRDENHLLVDENVRFNYDMTLNAMCIFEKCESHYSLTMEQSRFEELFQLHHKKSKDEKGDATQLALSLKHRVVDSNEPGAGKICERMFTMSFETADGTRVASRDLTTFARDDPDWKLTHECAMHEPEQSADIPSRVTQCSIKLSAFKKIVSKFPRDIPFKMRLPRVNSGAPQAVVVTCDPSSTSTHQYQLLAEPQTRSWICEILFVILTQRDERDSEDQFGDDELNHLRMLMPTKRVWTTKSANGGGADEEAVHFYDTT
jgi:hypothetical protein